MSSRFTSPSIWTTNTQATIKMQGADRVSFLQNFCTNDIKKLEPNASLEAFIPNVKGKCLGYVTVFNAADALLLITANHNTEDLVAHLERYVITEDVEISLSLGSPNTLLTGDGIEEWLQQHRPEGFVIANHWFSQSSYWIITDADEEKTHSLQLLDDASVHAARISNGTPLYGADITEDNFAQEVNRDSLAISFTKGCYLGQEPIARIDALGNVHWHLARVDISNVEVTSGQVLNYENKPAVKVRSISKETRIALAYVRRKQNVPGESIQTDSGEVRVL